MNEATPAILNRRGTTHNVLSRIVVGGTYGLALLFLGDLIAGIVVWSTGAWHKGSPWWDYVCWSAAYGLPLAFILGVLAALLIRRSQELQLTLAQFGAFSFLSAFLSIMQKPAIDRLRVGRPIPLYESVPTMMAAFFGLVALVCFAWLLIYHLGRRLKSKSKQA